MRKMRSAHEKEQFAGLELSTLYKRPKHNVAQFLNDSFSKQILGFFFF